jgi:DNA-3-methyladenine glycosylase
MTISSPLKIPFYNRPTLEVARDLLGCVLVRHYQGKILSGRIIETEAYIGQNDKACHASKGLTERTRVMFGPPGRAYIYLIYGMYHCLNVVTEADGFPAAVLIRGLKPLTGFGSKVDALTPARHRLFLSGPGKICREMHITRTLNANDMSIAETLYVLPRDIKVTPTIVRQTPRIGVDYAGDDARLPWRFLLDPDK